MKFVIDHTPFSHEILGDIDSLESEIKNFIYDHLERAVDTFISDAENVIHGIIQSADLEVIEPHQLASDLVAEIGYTKRTYTVPNREMRDVLDDVDLIINKAGVYERVDLSNAASAAIVSMKQMESFVLALIDAANINAKETMISVEGEGEGTETEVTLEEAINTMREARQEFENHVA